MKFKCEFTVEAAYVVSIVLLITGSLISLAIDKSEETVNIIESCETVIEDYVNDYPPGDFLRQSEIIKNIGGTNGES